MLGLLLPPKPAPLTPPDQKQIEISVIVPIFNEEDNIPALMERLTTVLSGITSRYEIIAVDDGSRDRSWTAIAEHGLKNSKIRGISFSRNFGHQTAITAGMEMASGEAVVIIDADLQDPPELIRDMVAKWREGCDVVYAVRRKREGETFAKLVTAKVFYWMIKRMTHIEIPVNTGDFRLLNRRALIAFLAMPERQRFVRGMISWIGFRQIGIPYNRDERYRGKSKYTYRRMFRFAFDGITSFSYLPLELASYLGFASAGASFLIILYAVVIKIFDHRAIQGWASTIITTLFLGGIQLIMIGLLGEYLGRIHEELKKRPLYIVKDTANITPRE